MRKDLWRKEVSGQERGALTGALAQKDLTMYGGRAFTREEEKTQGGRKCICWTKSQKCQVKQDLKGNGGLGRG